MMVTSPVEELRSWTRAQVEAVSKGWWVLLLTGVIGVLAGGIIVFSRWNVDNLVVFVGTLLIVRGGFTAFSIPVDGSMRTWSVVVGVIEILVGIGVFAWPGPSLLVIALSIGWLLLFRGTMAIVGAIVSRKLVPYWGLVLAAGVLEVVVAIYLLGRPDVTLFATVLAIGFSAMLYGAMEIVAALEVKNLPQRLDQLAGGLERPQTSRPLDPVATQ